MAATDAIGREKMPRTFDLVASSRDRAATGRSLLAASIAIVSVGVLIPQIGRVAVPADLEALAPGSRRLVIAGDARGQCHVAARVNDSLIPGLLIDSGASGYITFGRNHAAQLGFDPAKLAYRYSYSSANGVGHEAKVRVREFRLEESFAMRDVPAVITEVAQSEPLLGIEILRRLNLRLTGGNCELSWP
jgi:clan AA aspartic protease (TIGR02281 family)